MSGTAGPRLPCHHRPSPAFLGEPFRRPKDPPSPSFSLFEILGFQPQALISQIQDIRNWGSERF